MQADDFQWFLDNYMRLYEQYGTSYLTIKDKRILGAYNSYADASEETMKTEARGTYIIQLCNGKESGYTGRIASAYFM